MDHPIEIFPRMTVKDQVQGIVPVGAAGVTELVAGEAVIVEDLPDINPEIANRMLPIPGI